MSIFPFIDSSQGTESEVAELPVLKEYAYDFTNNELLLNEKGCTYMVEKNEALRIWIFKALMTERFSYVAYSHLFGSEYQEQLIGHVMNSQVMQLELQRYITEALMVNPYIERLENFRFVNLDNGLSVTFECTSVYGTDNIILPVREVTI